MRNSPEVNGRRTPRQYGILRLVFKKTQKEGKRAYEAKPAIAQCSPVLISPRGRIVRECDGYEGEDAHEDAGRALNY